jgi:uncharacterized protein (TIGR04255 family)
VTDIETIPEGLKDSPQYEALFEVRFTSALGDIGPSVLLANLFRHDEIGAQFNEQSKLPASYIPEEARKADPALTYVSEYSLKGSTGQINIGRRSIVITQNYTSKDWSIFQDLITKVLNIVNDFGAIEEVERYSLKYTNFIPSFGESFPARDLLDITVKIADRDLTSERFDFRTELREDGKISIVQVVSTAKVRINDSDLIEGTVFAIDCIQPEAEGSFISDSKPCLDELYSFLESRFYEMASKEMIKKYPGLKNAC